MKGMQQLERIDSFSGNWGFLSNFYPATVVLDGVEYVSVEHAYQAAKTLLPAKRVPFTYDVSPAQAKKMGRSLILRPDWDEVRVEIMRDLLMQKFYPTILRRKLMATFKAELVEGNWWHDTFFGVCNGNCSQPHEPTGKNVLGQLLMEVRQHYNKGITGIIS